MTGNATEVKRLTESFGVAVLKSERGETMTIDHSGAVMLLNPEGNLVAFFTMPHDPEKIAADYKLIVANG